MHKTTAPGMVRVFISSTHEDLEDFRVGAKNGVLNAGCHPELTEHWKARGDKTSYEICLDKVCECDVMVVLVAHRYGWEPEYQPGRPEDRKNMVWLECEAAHKKDIEVLALVVDEKADWPAEKKDSYELMKAVEEGGASAELLQTANRSGTRLRDFKEWLRGEGSGIVEYFKSQRDVELMVDNLLRAWKDRKRPATETRPDSESATLPNIPADYLEWVQRTFGTVELLGLDANQAQAGRLRQVYVPAVTDRPRDAAADGASDPSEVVQSENQGPVLLLERFGEQSLYAPGAPGAGKSTFCRWVAWLIATRSVPEHAIPAPAEFAESLPSSLAGKLPVLVALRDFGRELDCRPGITAWARGELSAALVAWVERKAPGGLTGRVFQAYLDAGRLVLMLDGVDEVPTVRTHENVRYHPRACLLSGLADAIAAWGAAGNRILLTSRPYGLTDAERRKLGLPTAPLGPLPKPLQKLFMRRWYAATEKEDEQQQYTRGLSGHLTGREDLAPLVQSPMLLTALCIRYGEGERLPEDLFALYDGLVTSVLFSRYPDDPPERMLARYRLAAVAHGMHVGPSAYPRSTPAPRVGVEEADTHLRTFATENPATEAGSVGAALRREKLLSMSGLLLPAPDEQVEFYHLSFQEFLTADHLERTFENEQDLHRFLRARGQVKEWRPTLMFLFTGMIRRNPQRGLDRLNAVIAELTRPAVRESPSLAVFVAQGAEVLSAKGFDPGVLKGRLKQVCLEAIEDEVEVSERHLLGSIMGRLGLDSRPGVGLDSDGVPDIDWVEIPGGEFVYQRGERRELDTFHIARYPVTNAQFRAFLDAPDGYGDDRWWAGLTHPDRDPGSPQWDTANHPRENVSWFEAMAYCNWLSARTGRAVRLPTEWQWERAARGTDGREFPWGADWLAGGANTREAGIGSTSTVGLFPAGASAEGVLDLAGNVWEWCSNEYSEPERTEAAGSRSRVLRGGSWGSNQDYARAGNRLGRHPRSRYDYVGFRVVCVSPIRDH